MLKNKFGMLKVLALALSVLMLVTLAACGNSGVAQEDMDNAIQAALSEQAKIEESKQAALASSLAQAQADAAQQAAAAQSSLEAAQAEASKQAAEASKAASIAESKAASAAIEASKAAASASEALKTTKAPVTTTTTTAAPIVKDDITAVQAKFAALNHELTNPLGNGKYYTAADYAELSLLFSKAAVELQNANTVAQAESILATVEVDARAIKNAKTEAIALNKMIEGLGDVETEVVTTVLEKKDEAQLAVGQFFLDFAEFYENYNYSIFSAEALKKADVKDAEDMVKYLDSKFYDAESLEYYNKTLGLELDLITLDEADAKIKVLANYIAGSLQQDMKVLYASFGLDFDDEGKDLYKDDKMVNGAVPMDFIWDAYYKYLVVAAVNGGDVAAADVVTKYDILLDENGKKVKGLATGETRNNPLYWLADDWKGVAADVKYADGENVYDEEAPTAWFTAEEFIEVYAYPCLNEKLAIEKEDAITELADDLTVARNSTVPAAIYAAIKAKIPTTSASLTYLANFDEAEDALDDIFTAFEDEIEDISFVADYKGNATIYDAQYDIWTKYAEAYVAAANAMIEVSKDVALEIYTTAYEEEIDKITASYDERTDAASLAARDQRIANLDAKKAAFEANVEAAPTYTLADLDTVEMLKEYDDNYESYEDIAHFSILNRYIGYVHTDGVDAEFKAYVHEVYADAIHNTFSTRLGTQDGYLGDAVAAFVDDLLIFRDMVDPTNDEGGNVYRALRGNVIPYVKGEGYIDDEYCSNTAKFEQIVAVIDKAIDDLYAVSVEGYSDKEQQLLTPNKDGYAGKKAKIYWINEQAKAWYEAGVVAGELDQDWLIEQEFLENPDLLHEGMKIHAKDIEGKLLFAPCECKKETKLLTEVATHWTVDADGNYVLCDCTDTTVDGKYRYPIYVEDTSRGKVIFNDIDKVKDTNKEGDFLTLNNTGIPYTYTRTAEQLAIMGAQSIYKAAYTEIQAIVIALPELDYLNEAIAEVTGTKEYKAIKSSVSGNAALLAEVEEFAKLYTDKLTSESKAVKYSFTGNTFIEPASFNDYIEKQPDEHFSYNDAFGKKQEDDTVKNNASNYNYENVMVKLNSYVGQFDTKFYSNDKADSNVVTLWHFKQDAVDYITNAINGREVVVEDNGVKTTIWEAGYKNTYVAKTENNVTTVTQRAGDYYLYDEGLTAASTAGKKFDAELTTLLESYVAKIEAIKLNSYKEIKNAHGEKLCSSSTDWNAWSINNSKKQVSAYVADLLGKAEAGEYAYAAYSKYTNTKYKAGVLTTVDGNDIETGDSRVLMAYKTVYEADFTNYAPTQPCATCGNPYNP